MLGAKPVTVIFLALVSGVFHSSKLRFAAAVSELEPLAKVTVRTDVLAARASFAELKAANIRKIAKRNIDAVIESFARCLRAIFNIIQEYLP